MPASEGVTEPDAVSSRPRGAGATRRWKERVDATQRRHPAAAFTVAVVRRYRDDRGGRLAALIGYYTFFSIFPLLLALVTILGFVLEDDPALRQDVIDSALGQFPVIGDTLRDTDGLEGSVAGLLVGLIGALWAGLAALIAAAHALDEVWAVPVDSRPRFVESRIRALLALGGLTLGLVATIVTSAVAALMSSSGLGRAGLWAGGLAITVSLVAVAYRALTGRRLTIRQHLPGAVAAGTALFVLQLVGAILLDRVVTGASTAYGTFGLVIGMLTWFSLIAKIFVAGAEVNVVIEHRLWPRSLTRATRTEGDLRAAELTRLSRTPTDRR